MLIDFYFSACKQTIGSESVIFCAILHVHLHSRYVVMCYTICNDVQISVTMNLVDYK